MQRSLRLLLCLFMSAGLLCCRGKPAERKRAAPHVSVAVLRQGSVPIYFEAIGQAIAPYTVSVRPQTAGMLLQSFVQQGQQVEAGQLLYTIDPRASKAAVDQAQALLEKDSALLRYADSAAERYSKVVDQDFISILTFEQYTSNAEAARAQVEADRASLVNAQLTLEYCNVTAPIAGKISSFAIDVGNIVIAYDPNAITVIRPNSPIDIIFSLPQQQFELVRRGQGDEGRWHFIATLPEDPSVHYEGESYFIDNQVDQDTATILIKGRLPNVNRELWPGEFVRVKVLERVLEKALLAPPGAVLLGRDGPYLYAVDGAGKAAAHAVQVVTRSEEYVAIAADSLSAGDTIIIDGQVNIAPGSLVDIL